MLRAEVALKLVEPHHGSSRRILQDRAHLRRVVTVGVHQPPVRQQRPDRLEGAAGLADRGGPHQQNETTPGRGVPDPGPDAELRGVGVAFHIGRRNAIRHAGHGDRGVDTDPPRVRVGDPDGSGRAPLIGGNGSFPCGDPPARLDGGKLQHCQERLHRVPGRLASAEHVADGAGRQAPPAGQAMGGPLKVVVGLTANTAQLIQCHSELGGGLDLLGCPALVSGGHSHATEDLPPVRTAGGCPDGQRNQPLTVRRLY